MTALLFSLFILFSYLVSKETFRQLDFDLTVKLQDYLPRYLDLPFSVLSLLGSVEVIGVILLVLSIYLLHKKMVKALFGLFLLPLGVLIELLAKLFIYHPGPPFSFYRGVIDFEFPSYFLQTDYSYPSGHTLRFTFLVFFLLTLFKSKEDKVFPQLILILLLLGMLISRVYLGEHWSSDVVGGFLLGASLGILASSKIKS